MALRNADQARLRAILTEVAPRMAGLSGSEQAWALGIACLNAGINPTWGEWAAFLRDEQSRCPLQQPPATSGRSAYLATESDA